MYQKVQKLSDEDLKGLSCEASRNLFGLELHCQSEGKSSEPPCTLKQTVNDRARSDSLMHFSLACDCQ